MSLDCAQVETLLHTARKAAEAEGIAVAIAGVDAGGSLLGFLRMPGAFLVSTDLAIDKAWTAAGMRMSTDELSDLLKTVPQPVRDGLLRRPRLTEVPGGRPLLVGEKCIGGVGISGGSHLQDDNIARAALAALEVKSL